MMLSSFKIFHIQRTKSVACSKVYSAPARKQWHLADHLRETKLVNDPVEKKVEKKEEKFQGNDKNSPVPDDQTPVESGSPVKFGNVEEIGSSNFMERLAEVEDKHQK